MARTITEIKASLVAEGITQATDQNNTAMLAVFNNTSKVSIIGLLLYIVAFGIWALEKIYDQFTSDVNTTIAAEMPHTTRWYRTMALAFQFGFSLLTDSDQFDNSAATADQITNSKVVQYAAVNETEIDGKRVLLVKIAGTDVTDLQPITDSQLAAFTAYMQEIKDAGVPITIYNRAADNIRATVDFYYDPLLLDGQGNRLDGQGSNPVAAAALNYLLNLPFNGEFSNAGFIDALQDSYGCANKNAFLKSAERQTGIGDWQAIPNTFIPDAGYARFADSGLTINYVAYVQS